MLDRDVTVALAKRMLAFHEAGTTEQAAESYRVPAARYVDAARWKLEMDCIFRRVPLPLALTCELRQPVYHPPAGRHRGGPPAGGAGG